MKAVWFRFFAALLLLAVSLAAAGCGPDFYLSESEAAAYASGFSNESSANQIISNSLPGQMLDLQFDNTSSPPTISSTNLLTLLRSYTGFGFMEGFNSQVHLDRLNTELQRQLQNWIRTELQLYMGNSSASVRLSQLASIQVHFLNQPAFTFHPERQAIAFNLSVRLGLNGTVEVNALDEITNLFFHVNGSYPLSVDINNFNLSGEASFSQSFADAAEITLRITPQPGAITVTDSGSAAAPAEVKDGVRQLVSQQLSKPLRQAFTQRYDYFALTGLGLTQATATTPSALQYNYRPRPDVDRPMLHMVARALDGKLYHLRKTEGGAGIISTVKPFPSLQTRVENEPALSASATDQLEVAATTTANELVYAHWRDETWGEQATFAAGNGSASGYTGKPALIASQPGQVEVIAMGRSGGLWHLRRLNGKWLTPVAIPINGQGIVGPFRDPVAVQSGTKMVMVFVDGQSRPRAMAFDLESGIWGQPTPQLSTDAVSYAPAAAASGDGRIDVVYVKMGGAPFHRVIETSIARFLPNTAQSGISIVASETGIGGTLNSTPALVCSSYRQLELVGRGTDDRLYHNRFVGLFSPNGTLFGQTITQGWQGWGQLNGNFAGSLTFERMSAFAVGSTRTGKVALASIREPYAADTNAQQLIYHNSYDSERFGTQPWQTVLWRGYEQVGTQRFIGQLALAVTDRHFDLGYVNNGWTIQGGRAGESNFATFAGNSSTLISSAPAPVDPVLVASAPGALDLILISAAGRLRHERWTSRGTLIAAFTLPAPSEQLVRVQPAAVGYGNGQLEMVALAQNGRLYHWRYQNGSWSAATQLSGTVISQPILVNLGSGQLVVLAVGGDQGLYYWSFTNGAWAAPRSIATGFPVSAVLFGPLAASSWGAGSVDLALVDSQSFAVYHGRIGPAYFTTGSTFGLTPSRAFMSVGGVVTDTPVLTAFSPTRLHILAQGTDYSLYSNWSAFDYANPYYPGGAPPPIVWNGYHYIGGDNLFTGGVVKTGANELTAVALDRDGRVVLSRYNGAQWVQFQLLLGQPDSTRLSAPRYRPALAAAL